MTAQKIRDFCRANGLTQLWNNLWKAAIAFRSHWQCAGLRHSQGMTMSAEEIANYATAKADFDKEATALSSAIRPLMPDFTIPDNIGEIAEAT